MFTHDSKLLSRANYFIVTISTPVDKNLIPDLSALENATQMIGQIIKKNNVIIFESTVYPGATEERLIPILEQQSGLKSGIDFYVGYSPERIVPGSKDHLLEKETKVISAQNKKALSKIKALYQNFSIELYEAPTIRVAEASKLLENIQRDVNIALMNEYAQIMYKMNISFHEVMQAATTKWNFIPFKPGLVGGHCISVDPYYLIYQAQQWGARVDLISQARKVNEQFIHFVYDVLVKLLQHQGFSLANAKIIILGMSYKPLSLIHI